MLSIGTTEKIMIACRPKTSHSNVLKQSMHAVED